MDQEVRLGGDQQREGLQRGGHIYFRIDQTTAAALYLAEVIDVPIGRNGPQHERRVDAAQFVRPRHVVDVQFNASAAPGLPSDPCRALQARESGGAVKWNLDSLVQWVGDRYRGRRASFWANPAEVIRTKHATTNNDLRDLFIPQTPS